MRIISKYKDFYDYYAQDYNADITYVRKPFFITDQVTLQDEFGWVDTIPIASISRRLRGFDICVGNIKFGIYPSMYQTPFVLVRYMTNTLNSEYFVYFFSRDDLEGIRTDNDLISFCEKRVREHIARKERPECYKPLQSYHYRTFEKNLGGAIMKSIKKIEAKEVFLKYDAPVMCEYDASVISTAPYWDVKDYKGKGDGSKESERRWIANCCFTMIGTDVMRAWADELMSLNTYTNIENFLWASRQEPMSEPDNKTKIINHGFDLKTSFRNIK